MSRHAHLFCFARQMTRLIGASLTGYKQAEMHRATQILVIFIGLILSVPAQAELVLSGQAKQGGLIIGTTSKTNTITIDGVQIETDEKGRFLIGFHRDDVESQLLQISKPDGTIKAHILTPKTRDWKTQRIDGLETKYVTPPDEVLARISSDRQAVIEARRYVEVAPDLFETGFKWPISGPVTGIYGSQRILNGKPRQPHYGIDIAAAKGTEVKTSAPGLVTMAKDLYYTGWTVIIHHGLGLSSTYSHLDSVSVQQGDRVDQDMIIGRVGSTGRSTGAHLDWRVNLGDKRLDPQIVSQVLDIVQ